VEDTNYIPACPSCGVTGAVTERCGDCPVLALEHARECTPAGRLLERTLDLDFDTSHFTVDWADITCEEDQALKILTQERSKWESERRDEQRQEQEQARLMDQMARKHGQR